MPKPNATTIPAIENTTEDRMLSPREISAFLGVSESWVYQRLSNPAFIGAKDSLASICIWLSPRMIRVSRKALLSWIERRGKPLLRS